MYWKKMVIYVPKTSQAKPRFISNRWNILDINFKKTAETSAKIAYDFQHGKSKTYFGTLMINPFLPRNAKLRETENVIRQLREGIKWGIGADKYVISGEFKMNGGWQWFIAAEYFKKYVQKIELLFFEKKITDLEGNILRIYNESESSQMVADIAAREKADSKRKMVAYINTSTEFTAEQLEELRTKALAATIAAEENVFTYDGHKEFKTLEKTNQNFRIIGHVKNVSNYYSILDAGIFTSRWETFGYSLIEAMKFKIPIISSKHMGNKDWINRFKIFKINHKNENQLKKYIIKIYNSKFSKKKYDLRMFDYKNNCEVITSIYRKMLVK